MASIVQGRIIFPKQAIPDPQGRNPKAGRPFVVISRNAVIQRNESVQAVGITGELQQSPADHYVLLAYGPTAKTGLKQKSAALCTWLINVAQSEVEIGKGYVHANIVEEIVTKVRQIHSIPDDEDSSSE